MKLSSEIKQLASFSQTNPNPIVETDLTGKISYLNPAAQKLFSDLKAKDNKHIYLAGINLLIDKFKNSKKKSVVRKIKAGNLWLNQTIHYIPDIKRVRVYSSDISEIMELKKTLREGEKRLKKTQEIAHLGTWEFDVASKYRWWSDETCRLYGYKPGKVIPSHKTFLDIVHPQDRKITDTAYYDSLRKNKDGYSAEYRILKKSTGELRILYDKCQHIRNSSGEIVRSIGFVQDITERKSAEELLKESEEKFRAVADTAQDAIVSADSSGKIVYFNKGAEHIFGHSIKEALGKPLTVLMPQRFREDHQRGFSRFLAANNAHLIGKTIELTGKRKNGNEFPLELSLANWETNKGIFFTAIIRDITVRKQAEIDLEKFKLAVDNAEEHIIITDLKGNILYANSSVEKITGYSGKEIIGKKPSLWGKQMPKEFYEKLWQTIKTEKKHFTGELVNKRKNGQLYNAEVLISQVFDENKNIRFFIGIERDITERKNLDQRKDDFITIAGHELRTPVSAVNITNQMLQDLLADNPKALKYLKKIEQQTSMQANLINDLLNVSKIQTGRLEIRKEQFDLQNLAEETAEDMQKTTKTHKIIIKGRIYDKILADRERIKQVLTNFYSNAIKFSPRGKKIAVELKNKQKEVVVGVTDYGIGIPKEHHNRIFERFYRVYGSGNKAYPGLGMGLYISYQIIKLHHGNIWFESMPGKGSTFYFSLPIQK